MIIRSSLFTLTTGYIGCQANNNIQHYAVLVDCTLEIVRLAIEVHKHFIEIPFVARPDGYRTLSRGWQHQDKRNEAHELLAEVYHWFTEGFETKDLQEAKALLAELS